jgi:YVTN family beta-propeller protein
MKLRLVILLLILLGVSTVFVAQRPGPSAEGYLLPNGWRITPLGKVVNTEDLVLNIVPTPDRMGMVAIHSGFNPHGLVVIDGRTDEAVQRVPVPIAWMGLAWHPDGSRLYVSGGNNKDPKGIRAPVYVFGFAQGRLTQKPVAELQDTEIEPAQIYWSGLVHHPVKPLLFAANRTAGQVVVFDTEAKRLLARIPTEVNPYDLVLSTDGRTLYCSNWASDSVSVIDTELLKVRATIGVGDNPNDMVLARDGRLFVVCSNDNSVVVIDTKLGRAVETIVTAIHPRAPEGSTPNALALDPDQKTLYVANADNNSVAVVDVSEAGKSAVLGFLPSGWYPSAVAVSGDGKKLYVGTAKGVASSSNIRGPNSPLPPGDEGRGSTKSLMKGTVHIVDIASARRDLRKLTAQVYANSPYKAELLSQARPALRPSIVPRQVGVGSPIKHVIYFIKENRTYDQVLGDMPQGNGDARLAIFGRQVTPNHHKIAEEFVLLDNLYCDAEVSADGHQWSNAAYATDFNEKNWPASYGGKSNTPSTAAMYPASGYMWDQAARKGLTYRSYGEMARRVSEGEPVRAQARGLEGHVAQKYLGWGARDTANAVEFIREFDEYEKNYDSKDPNKRLPNFIVVCLPENHTRGTRPGAPTPRAAVASNDYALGQIVDRVSHSRYWPETAIFTIEDDAQDGPDHVDARRTVGLVISPYCHRRIVDSTLYTTSAMLRTIELLLGMQPMSQYDAAATPMYASFSSEPA